MQSTKGLQGFKRKVAMERISYSSHIISVELLHETVVNEDSAPGPLYAEHSQQSRG
jgi:hypothetical protein